MALESGDPVIDAGLELSDRERPSNTRSRHSAGDGCHCRRRTTDAGCPLHDYPIAIVKFGRLGACRRFPDLVVEYRCGEKSRIVVGTTGRRSIFDSFRSEPPAPEGKQRRPTTDGVRRPPPLRRAGSAHANEQEQRK
ncbi:hypothetical protein [Burkholderia sp. Bp9012]|uniref:hypothetical protein n=1 Tax=Burkholderia sp. Bp9012 TaxID=2184562 RepID=UPI000F5A78D9|nr:hypothetical protein [Burkholderia sp. Bp9012]